MVPDALWLEIVMCQLIISALIILSNTKLGRTQKAKFHACVAWSEC